MEEQFFEQKGDITALNEVLDKIRAEIGKVIIGQQSMVDLMLTGLLCDGHILVEGVPGVAKTLAAKLVARVIDVQFARLQFTPDMMPSDVIGTAVFDPAKGSFVFKQGPIFSNIVLIDEINRAPAKTQAALFEVMEERQVTVDGYTHQMDYPFIVLATQNPIEQEGTYRLPEAQLDRFLFKIEVGYPNLSEEVQILHRHHAHSHDELIRDVQKVIGRDEIRFYRQVVQQVTIEPKLIEFIAAIIHETRNNPALFLGASPRASLALMKAAKATAALRGRNFVIPEDIVDMAPPVLRHRIMLTPEKEMEGMTPDVQVDIIIKSVEVPR